MRVVEYHMAFGSTPIELDEVVNERIKKGWVPIGGIAVSHLQIKQDGYLWVEFWQAMVRYGE